MGLKKRAAFSFEAADVLKNKIIHDVKRLSYKSVMRLRPKKGYNVQIRV
jgi:hypothetical protein